MRQRSGAPVGARVADLSKRCRGMRRGGHGRRVAAHRAVIESLEPRLLLSGAPIISEFMADNETTLADGDGVYSDWIEIQNVGDSPIDLLGWHLTDTAASPTKWTFPSVVLQPGGQLIVFASGQTTNNYVDGGGYLHTNFALNNGGEYLALFAPDGMTAATEFAPAYPPQQADVSYGTSQTTTQTVLIDEGGSVRALVPADGSLGTRWTGGAGDEPFDDSGWIAGTTGVGYDLGGGGAGGGAGVGIGPTAVAYYSFDDAATPGTAQDAGALSAYPGTILGPVYVPNGSPVGGTHSLSFDGVDDRLLVDGLRRPSGAWTYSFWLNPALTLGVGSPRMELVYGRQQGGEAQPRPHLTFSREGDGRLGLYAFSNGAQLNNIKTATNQWMADQWYHVAFTYDGGAHRVFVNGVLETTVADTGVNTADTGFSFGSNPAGGSVFDGLLDELAIFDGALSYQLTGNQVTGGDLFKVITLGIGSVHTPPQALPFITLDFGQTGQRVEPGAVGISATGNGVAIAGTPATAVTGDVISVAVSAVDWRDRGDSTNGAASLVQLTEDHIKHNSQPFTVTLGSLPAGAYRVTSYHTDADFDQSELIRIFVTDANGSNVLQPVTGNADKLINGVNNLTTTNAAQGSATFTIVSDGTSAVAIRFDGTAATDLETPLSALKIERLAEPTYDDLIQTDLEAAMHEVSASAYMRMTFNVADPSAVDLLTLNVKYDDGFAAYLNGVLVASANAPGGVPGFDATATGEHADSEAREYESFNITAHASSLRTGTNVLAIHGLNIAADDGDFLIVPQLIASSVQNGAARYFPDPTPGEVNNTGIAGYVADTQFDVHRGFYTDPIDVTITTATEGASIYYTTNGSIPSPTNGTLYAGPVHITTTTTLRAAAFKADHEPTNVDTHTYIFVEDVLRQPNNPTGFPLTWGAAPAVDYEMDPQVVDDPNYSQRVRDALTAIPTLSLTLPIADMFGPSGIYSNPTNGGFAWERATSAELIHADGSEGFQIDAGLRVQGGASRTPANSPKHSLSLRFRNEYGDGMLNYPLFDGSQVEDYDSLQLRAMYNNSWIHWDEGQRNRGLMMHDQYMRDLALAMGNADAGHGQMVHLYIDGLYWGVYVLQERPTAAHYAEYHGGDEDDYDALNGGAVTDGTITAWNEMKATVASRDWAAIQQVLDVDNYIDFMILQRYGSNRDLKADGNWRAAGGGPGRAPWRFYLWDTERVLEGVTDGAPAPVFDPPGLYADLIQIQEFRVRFGDRLQMHLFNGGVLTSDAAADAFTARVNELDVAIVAESARWGDYRRDVHQRNCGCALYTRDVHWQNEVDRLLTSYFPQRTDNVIAQYRAEGLLPSVDAPQFSQHGGVVTAGYELEITTGATEILVDTVVLPEFAPVSALVPADDSLGLTWTTTAFNDAGWLTGNGGVGYEDAAAEYAPLIGLNVLGQWNALETSVYTRFEFTLDAGFDAAEFDRLTLRMKYDDGFIAYLNGVRIVADRAPAVTAYNGLATSSHSDAEAVTFVDFNVTPHLNLLQPGQNVLAIQGMNNVRTSSDLLISPQLVVSEQVMQSTVPVYYTLDGSDPRQEGGMVSPNAMLYEAPVPLHQSAEVKARALAGGVWSALNKATFIVDLPLRVTEVHYNPAEGQEVEFIELKNIGLATIDLTGVRFIEGIDFDFTGSAVTSLLPGQYVVVVRNAAAFTARYGAAGIMVAGEFANGTGLNNGGERLTLVDAVNSVVQTVAFSDTWHAVTDGGGASLDKIDPESSPNDSWDDSGGWRASGIDGGTPGRPDPVDAALPGDTNYNGTVDIGDLSRLAVNFGLDGTGDPSIDVRWQHGDFNGDRKVDIRDLSALATRFGQMQGAAAGAGDELGGDATVEADLLAEAPAPVGRGRTPVAVMPITSAGPSGEAATKWSHIADLLAVDS